MRLARHDWLELGELLHMFNCKQIQGWVDDSRCSFKCLSSDGFLIFLLLNLAFIGVGLQQADVGICLQSSVFTHIGCAAVAVLERSVVALHPRLVVQQFWALLTRILHVCFLKLLR